MEYLIRTAHAHPDLATIAAGLAGHDPAAVVDLDPRTQALRIATVLEVTPLIAALNETGVDASPERLERVPSVCCGGCGG
jgi:hypothetical protein